MTCPFVRDDGAYVLGALTPSERLEFERHLAGCPDCSRRVRELAGLTGLLARVSPRVLEDQPSGADDVPPVPGSVLSALVGDVRRDHRRRRWLAAGLAAAAVVVGAVVGVLGAGLVGDGDAAGRPEATSPTASPSGSPSAGPGDPSDRPSAAPSPTPDLAPARRMRPVAETTMTARLSLTGLPWGTRLDLTCSYPAAAPTGRGGTEYDDHAATTYTLVVRTRDGAVQEVATWRALAGRTMRLTGATATAPGRIEAVQVRTADGSPVLQLRG